LILICLAVELVGLIFTAGSEAKLARDQLGREVQVPDDPVRLVSLAPSLTEIVFALGEERRLSGVTQHCDFPPAAQSLPNVGSYVHLDLEKIVALKPDLCIATKDGNPPDVVERLATFKIPAYVVNPRDINGVMETVLEVGQLLGAGGRAESLVSAMRARTDHVKSLVEQTQARPRVFFQIGVAPIVSLGYETFIHEIITTAGGHNLAEGPIPYPRFTREQILALKPEVIIITSMTRGEDFERVKEEWGQWDQVPAVRNGRIFVVDSNLFDRPTPRLVDGLELLVRLIHPELF
jgi:iron complex transport system substrate-binding protein